MKKDRLLMTCRHTVYNKNVRLLNIKAPKSRCSPIQNKADKKMTMVKKSTMFYVLGVCVFCPRS